VSQKAKINFCNEDFFNRDTLCSCYWAGFIAADGTIVKTKYQTSLILWLAAKDKIHLEKFKSSLNFSGEVLEYNYNNKPSARVIINSAKIATVLKNRYNIIPNKSLVLKPPKRLRAKKSLAWIKGYIDGDGSIIKYKGKYKINVIETEQILDWIQSCLSSQIKVNINNKIAPRGNVFLWQVAGLKASKIYELLKSLDTPQIKRKWCL